MVQAEATTESTWCVVVVATAIVEPTVPIIHFWNMSFISLQTVKHEQWRFR